jgi:hypothetical protein
MAKSEEIAAAASTLLTVLATAFKRVGTEMQETSAKLEGARAKIREAIPASLSA